MNITKLLLALSALLNASVYAMEQKQIIALSNKQDNSNLNNLVSFQNLPLDIVKYHIIEESLPATFSTESEYQSILTTDNALNLIRNLRETNVYFKNITSNVDFIASLLAKRISKEAVNDLWRNLYLVNQSTNPFFCKTNVENVYLITAFIKQGVDINLQKNIKTSFNETALHYALHFRKPKMVELLLKHKATPTLAMNFDGIPLLFWAAFNNKLTLVQLLSQTKEFINYATNTNKTALMAAAGEGHLNIVQHLVNAGANRSIKDIFEKNAYNCAQETIVRTSKNEETFKKIENLVKPDNHGKERYCFTCQEKTTNRCAGCKKVYYCKRECQKKDWRQHKIVCSEIKNV